jgi:hypothetical protein
MNRHLQDPEVAGHSDVRQRGSLESGPAQARRASECSATRPAGSQRSTLAGIHRVSLRPASGGEKAHRRADEGPPGLGVKAARGESEEEGWSGQEDLYFSRSFEFRKLLILIDAKRARAAEIPQDWYMRSTRAKRILACLSRRKPSGERGLSRATASAETARAMPKALRPEECSSLPLRRTFRGEAPTSARSLRRYSGPSSLRRD